MPNHLDVYNRIHPATNFQSPIVGNAGICVVRPLGGIRNGNQADLSKDSYTWNASTRSFQTNFNNVRAQISRIKNSGFRIHQMVLDNPSWDFQRDRNGNFAPGESGYVVSTYGNAAPPRDFAAWSEYLKAAMRNIVSALGGTTEALKVQYGIGREIGTSGHWSGSQARFFEFYRISVNAIRSVLPGAKVGSHFLWGSSSNSWGPAFVNYCRANNVPYNFVGISYYPFYNRAGRTNFNSVYKKDFGVITSNPNWNRNAKLEIHEFALIKTLNGAGNGFDSAPRGHQNSFLVGMMKMFYDKGMNNLNLWGTGAEYNPVYGQLLNIVGNTYYRNAVKGTRRSTKNYVNAIFSQNTRNNSYNVMAYNYSAESSSSSFEDLIIKSTINTKPGSTFRYRTLTYDKRTGRIVTSAYKQAKTRGTAGSNKSTAVINGVRILTHSFVVIEFDVVSGPTSGGGGGGGAATNIAGSWYKIKNKGTNRFLDGNDLVLTSNSAQNGFDKQFRFIKKGNYYNIDIRKQAGTGRGILRAKNDGNNKTVVITEFAESFDRDKQFIVTKVVGNTYSIKNRARNLFMQDINGSIRANAGADNSDRTKWILIRTAAAKEENVKEGTEEISDNPLTVFPNPSSNGIFQLNRETSWDVYDIKGRHVLKGNSAAINLATHSKGIYILKTKSKTFKLVY